MSRIKNQMYYIQDTKNYTDCCPVWWDKDKDIFVKDIEKAQLFTYDEAMQIYKEDITKYPWKKQDVGASIRMIADSKHLIKDDKDGFYSTLERIALEEKNSNNAEHQSYLFNNYVKTELFTIREYINFELVKNENDFEIEFEKAKSKMDWFEHYYPSAYNKSTKEIFEDLMKYDLVFCCSECKNIFWSTQRNIKFTSKCNTCVKI